MAKKIVDKAFLRLIKEHQGIIHKVCSIYCNDPVDKQDLFQEIVLQIWRAYPSFKGQSKVSTWMYRIGLNTAISLFRKKKRRPQLQALSPIEYQIAATPVDQELEERLKLLRRAIEKLNKVEKAIIMLYLEEHSYTQIAEIMGMSESNIGVKIHRIKSKLKQIVKK